MASINELKKTYKIYELCDKPMLRLNNLILKKFNFNIGDNITVTYELNRILIEKNIEPSILAKKEVTKNGTRYYNSNEI